MAPEWLTDYIYGAVIGIMVLFLVGSIVNQGFGSGITGYAAADFAPEQIRPSGTTRDFKVISFGCELTPAEIHVNRGDFVLLKFTSYDLSGSEYIFNLPSYDLKLRVKGSEVSSAKIFANKVGAFTYYVEVPCEKYGFQAQGKLYVH